MKLMTVTKEYQGYRTATALPATGVDVEGTLNELRHDAAAAHALMRAMDRVSSQVTFHTMTNRECVAQLLDAVRGTADELMREWGFEPEAGKP